MCLSKEEVHLLNKWLEWYLHQEIELTSDHMISTSLLLHAALVFLLLSPSSSPPTFLFLFCSPWGLLLFPRTVRRYRKDQITMATISHIVIAHTLVWWLFLLWRVGGCCPYLIGGAPSNLFWCRRNNVAICWIHVFAQSKRRWITSIRPCDDSSQSVTWLRGQVELFVSVLFLKFETHTCSQLCFGKVNAHHQASSIRGSRNENMT